MHPHTHTCSVLQRTVVNCSTLLHNTTLHCTALDCTALYCTTRHYTALYCTSQNCTKLQLYCLCAVINMELTRGRCCTAIDCKTALHVSPHLTFTELLQCSEIHCSAVQCTAVQCRYSALQCNAVQCNTVVPDNRGAVYC